MRGFLRRAARRDQHPPRQRRGEVAGHPRLSFRSLFAEAALISGEGYPANARALTSSAVILLPKTQFVALLRKRPELALRMLASMGAHLRNVVALLDDLTLKDAEARCIHWLLRHCSIPYESAPFEIRLEHPKRTVAAELNITSETLSALLPGFVRSNSFG